MDDEDLFNDLLGNAENEKETKVIDPITKLVPKKLILTDRCLKLGQMIGPITQNIGKKRLEVGGFYTVKLGDDTFTYNDFVIPNNLSVTAGSIRIDENYDSAAREIQEINDREKVEMRLGAMFHIHPDEKGGLYHSYADDLSLKNLANKMAKTTRRIYESPLSLIESTVKKEYGDDMYCLRGDSLSDAIKRFFYPNDELFNKVLAEFGIKNQGQFKKSEFLARLLDTIDDKTYEPRTVNFAVSFVFNNWGDMPYIKMGVEESFCLSGKSSYTDITDLEIDIINKGENLPTTDEVAKLIKTRVVFPKNAFKNGKVVYALPEGYSPDGQLYEEYFGQEWEEFSKRYSNGAITKPYDVKLSVAKKIERAATEHKLVVESPKPIKPLVATVLKSKDDKYTYREVVTEFVLQAYSYVNLHRQNVCKYSTYMSELLNEAGVYLQSKYQNSKSSVASKPTIYAGLNSTIKYLGPLVEDHPDIVEKHQLKGYRLENIIDNFSTELVTFKDETEETIKFMWEFNQSDIEGRNQLLEQYVQRRLETQTNIIETLLNQGK